MIRFVALAFAGFFIAWTSVCAASRDVVFNTDDCVSALNLARTASLDVPLPALTAASVKEYTLYSILKWKRVVYPTLDDTDCTVDQSLSPFGIGGLVLKTDGVKRPDAKTIARLIEKELDDGLSIIGNNYEEKLSLENSSIYSHWAAQNLVFLMQSTATKVMCAVPSNCEKGQSVVICAFDELPTMGKPPFSQALLSALQARKAAKMKMQRNIPDEDGTVTPIPATDPPIPGAARAITCTLAVFLSTFALLVAY